MSATPPMLQAPQAEPKPLSVQAGQCPTKGFPFGHERAVPPIIGKKRLLHTLAVSGTRERPSLSDALCQELVTQRKRRTGMRVRFV